MASRKFVATPQQAAFWKSPAFIRAYGGAMGGGKSRCICEMAQARALEYPGIQILICRQERASIQHTTKRTYKSEVLAPELAPYMAKKESAGEDWIRYPNGSVVHFAGLSEPERWFSAEIGMLIVDQVEECDETTIIKLITRLRQRGMPNDVLLSFNPESPGHWLMDWCIKGAERTEFGFRKDALYPSDSDAPLGTMEFVFASPKDNPHLDEHYISKLEGMPRHWRRRYLEGKWEFVSGTSFFDADALAYHMDVAAETKPILTGVLVGDIHEDFVCRTGRRKEPPKQPIRLQAGGGPLIVWKRPVRGDSPHRYVMAIDASAGRGRDFAGVQVIDVEAFEQVAEFQSNTIEPDELAKVAYRLGRVYNNALAVPEVTGGWGFAVDQELKKLRYPRLYTKRVLDRLSKLFTDKTGWDTTERMRAHMLGTLEQVLREREFGLYSQRALIELGTFVLNEKGKPEAQPGCHDDLVMSLAIGVTVAVDQPKQLRRQVDEPVRPQFAATGY